jgi:hypothetical protein
MTKPSYKNYVNLDTTGATRSLITLFLLNVIWAVFDENTFNNIVIIYIWGRDGTTGIGISDCHWKLMERQLVSRGERAEFTHGISWGTWCSMFSFLCSVIVIHCSNCILFYFVGDNWYFDQWYKNIIGDDILTVLTNSNNKDIIDATRRKLKKMFIPILSDCVCKYCTQRLNGMGFDDVFICWYVIK